MMYQLKTLQIFLTKMGIKTAETKNSTKDHFKIYSKIRNTQELTHIGEQEYPNAVPAIIDIDLFNKVQTVIEKYKHSPGIKKASEPYLLSGKIFCGYCKSPMIGKSGTAKSSTTYKYYRCNHLHNAECKKKSIGKEYIENLVVRKCKALLTDKSIDKIARKIYETCQKENNSNIVIKNLEKRKKQIKNNIENLMRALENRTAF